LGKIKILFYFIYKTTTSFSSRHWHFQSSVRCVFQHCALLRNGKHWLRILDKCSSGSITRSRAVFRSPVLLFCFSDLDLGKFG